MSSSKELMVGGKPLSALRVVDLKEELEKRGLSKSGSKKDLADRLKKNLLLENQRNIQSSTDEEQLPNLSTREQLAENPFLRDYFESQAELYHSQKVVKKLYEGMAHTPDEQQPAAAPVVEDTKEQRQPSPEPQVPQAQPELEKPSEPAPAPYTKALRSKATPVVAESEPVEPETPTVKESKVPPAKVVPELVVASKSKPPKIEEYEAKKDEQPSRPRRGEQPSKPSKVDTAAKPSTVEATKPPKVEEVSKPPKDETVAKPPKIEAVAKPPKVEAVAKPPKVEAVAKPPKVETVAKPPKVEAVAKPPKVEEPTKPLKIEEPSKPLKVEEPSKSLKIEEPSKPLKVDEAVKPPVIEEAAIPPVVEEAAIPLKIEEAAIPPKIEEAAIPPKIEEPSKAPQVEEPSKAPQVEEVAKPPIVEETAKPLKVDEAAKPLIVGDVAITPKVEEPPTAPKVQEPPPLKVQEPVNHVKDEPSKLPVVEERVEPPKVEEKLKSPIVEKVQKPEVPSKVETEPPLKKECKPQAVEEPQKTLVEEKLEPTESSYDAGAVEDKLVKELPTPEPEPQKADKGLKPVKKLISEEESEKLSVNPTKDQRDEPSVDKETVPNELPQSKDDKEEEESEKATDEDEDEEESRVEEEEEPEKPPVQKTLQSSPRRPMEEVLDYGDEESNDKKEEETTTWKRRVLKRNFQPDIINEAKSGSVVSDSAKVVSSPKSPSENPDKIKAAVVRSEQMDVDEVLDYGEEESDIKKDEFIWTRRILRLKNRCSVVDKTEKKWNRGDRKPVVVTSKVLEAFFPDVKPLPEAEVRLEERIPKETEEPKESKVEAASENVDAAAIGGTLPNIKRKISIIPFEETVKELTPPRNPLTNILVITNLTRPFTLMQLKELLQRTGTIEDIWVDKIKSKCLAKFEKQADAEETRSALHGIKWPPSNPKALFVDFTTDSEFDQVTKEPEEKKVKVEKPKEAKALPVREWDLGKRSRSRSPGRAKRSGSGDRKRARKSISPHSRRSPHHDKKSRDHDIKEETQVKALDELFRKTTATPCLYWLPLTPEQISEKEELRRKRMVERERRLAEMEKLRPR